jgi:peptide/nickel transport system substrate-binding protein
MNHSSTRRLAALAALVLVAAAVLAVGCGGGGKSGSKGGGGGGTLVDGTTDTVTNIDPAGNYDYGSATLDAPIFQHLLEAGPGSPKLHPVLATKCEFQGGLTTYECELRKGVKFHNGATMTSADVVWSFDRVNKIKDESGIYTLLSNLKSVEAQGSDRVVFHLKAPQATWPFILTTGAAQIVPKNAYPANKLVPNTGKHYGTGQYMLTRYQPGQQAVLKKFKDYWGDDAAKADTLIIRYYTKSSTMKLDLEGKRIDMAFQSFTPTELSSLKNEDGIVVHQGKGSSIRYLVLNVKRPPTNQLAVRQAIAYMMPRQSIAKLYRGTVKPLYSQVPAGLPGHVDVFADQFGKSPNASKAKAALQKAGISTPVNLTLWYTPTHYGDASADEFGEIKRALESSGVFKVTLQSAEWATYSDALGKSYGAFQLGWFPDYVDGENYLLPFYSSASNFTENNYKSSAMDSILTREQAAKDTGAREDLIRQAQTLSAKDVPIIPYWQGNMVAVSRDNVDGIDSTLDPTFIMRFWLISKS